MSTWVCVCVFVVCERVRGTGKCIQLYERENGKCVIRAHDIEISFELQILGACVILISVLLMPVLKVKVFVCNILSSFLIFEYRCVSYTCQQNISFGYEGK